MFVTANREHNLNFKDFRQMSTITIAFLLMLLTKSTSAQLLNLYELPEGELAYNFGYVYNNHPTAQERNRVHAGIASIDWGHNENLKTSIIGSLAWRGDELSPGLKFRFMHIGKILDPYIGYFFTSNWGAVGFNETDLVTTTGFSVFGRIINAPAWEIKPFVGILQSTGYYRYSNANEEWTLNFGSKAEVGIELEIAQNFSVLGSWRFVFNNPYNVIHIGINLHY